MSQRKAHNRIQIEVGQKFGRLTVIREVEQRKENRFFLCECGCGNKTICSLRNLRSGHTKSCGCLIHERSVEANTTHGNFSKGKQTRLYAIWAGIKKRCLNLNVKIYKYYGGRAITICSDWMRFEPFRDWAIANGYRDDLTIHRIDNNGNYEPQNCCWLPYPEHCRCHALARKRNEKGNRFA